MNEHHSDTDLGPRPDRKALLRHMRSLPKEARRDVQVALASGRPVRHVENAALAAELAASNRRWIVRTGIAMALIAPAIAVSVVWMLDRAEGRQPSAPLLAVVVVFAVVVIGVVLAPLIRRLRVAERVNRAVHGMASVPSLRQASLEGQQGAYTPGQPAGDSAFPGLRELRTSIALGLAGVLVLTVVQLVLVGPESLWRLGFALVLFTLWWRAATEPGRVALLLILIYGAGLAGSAPTEDAWGGATLAVLLAGLVFALAGLWRSRAYRRAVKAERKRLLSQDKASEAEFP